MVTYVDASHNMLFRLNPEKWEADLVKSSEGDVTGYQEAGGAPTRRTLKAHCAANNRGVYHPQGTSVPISWKKDVFTPVKTDGRVERGVVEVHEKHGTAKYNPARDFTWIGLTHIETGYKILRINVHTVAGATKDEDETEWGDALDEWKNWGLANYYLDLLAFTAQQMSREVWDVVSVGGDFNAYLNNLKAWYYPGRMLPALYQQDKRPQGLDHLLLGHGSDARDGRRWTVRINSDHPLHLVRRTLVKVQDYPSVH